MSNDSKLGAAIERAWEQHEHSKRVEANKSPATESKARVRNRQRNATIRRLHHEIVHLRKVAADAFNEGFAEGRVISDDTFKAQPDAAFRHSETRKKIEQSLQDAP